MSHKQGPYATRFKGLKAKKPFELAMREATNPDIADEWVEQAREWLASDTATQSQKELAENVIEQWGQNA